MRERIERPVRIGNIEFDALISLEESRNADVPSYPTDEGFSVSDNVALQPLELSLVVYVSNTPVTWRNRHKVSKSRVAKIEKELEILFKSKEVVTVRTSNKTYRDMVISGYTISKSLEDGYSRRIPIKLTQVLITSATVVQVSGGYGFGGSTETSNGNANTTIEKQSLLKTFLPWLANSLGLGES